MHIHGVSMVAYALAMAWLRYEPRKDAIYRGDRGSEPVRTIHAMASKATR
jgi:hypothetical protein